MPDSIFCNFSMIDITDFIISYTKFIEAQIRDRQGIQWNNSDIEGFL